MTTLAAFPMDELPFPSDESSPLAKLRAADFEEACRAVADDAGWVNPNLVSAWLRAKWGEVDPRSYSGAWAGACGRNGFMDTHREVQVPIDGRHSKGNSNKSLPMRRLRGVA